MFLLLHGVYCCTKFDPYAQPTCILDHGLRKLATFLYVSSLNLVTLFQDTLDDKKSVTNYFIDHFWRIFICKHKHTYLYR